MPSGLYVRRGRAVPFSQLSGAQRHAWRSHWAEKAAETRAELAAAAREEIAVVEETRRLPGEMKRRGLRTFAADAEGYRTGDVLTQLQGAAKDKFPKANRGTFVATVEWPDDPRSQRGRPYTTRISREARSWENEGGRADAKKRARGYFDAVAQDPQGRLSGPADQHPSRGRGRAVLKSVRWMTWHARPKRRKGR